MSLYPDLDFPSVEVTNRKQAKVLSKVYRVLSQYVKEAQHINCNITSTGATDNY